MWAQAAVDCGNSILDQGETCDDGNILNNDGCSSTCQIEDGWQCANPTSPGEILDPGFEQGTPNPSWEESSTNFDSPICDDVLCGTGTGSDPVDGLYWAWFGGINVFEESSVSQSVVIPSTATSLQFVFEASACDSASDYVELLIDNNREWIVDGSSALCGVLGYTQQSVDISVYADGNEHIIEFHSESFAANEDLSNFFIDMVSLPGSPSLCTKISPKLTLNKIVINDNGGTATASDWTLMASGPSGFSGNGPSVSSDDSFVAGDYILSESGGPVGYSAGSWICEGGVQNDIDSITVTPNDIVICTITNNDIEIDDSIFRNGFESN